MRDVVRGVGLGRGVAWACALMLAASACGKARVEGAPSAGGGASSGAGSAAAGSGGASDANGGEGAQGGGAGDAGAGGAANGWVPAELRRLTSNEYTATITDVLGTTQQLDLSGFTTEVDGFDNNAAANGVPEQLLYRYLETAESLANEVFASAPLRSLIVTCAQADDTACVQQIISQAGLRLFRRPLLDAEIASYQKAYARARARSLSHEEATKEVLTALLTSAQFVYRMELEPSALDTEPFEQYAQATRLSYLLWGSAPDGPLLGAAEREELGSDAQLSAELARLLNDPKSARFVQNFGGQWFKVSRLAALTFDSQKVARWSPELASSASNELLSFFSELLGSGQVWSDLLYSHVHFVDPGLAQLYGLPASSGRVVQATGERQGLLGMVGFLAQTSPRTRSEPSRRGAWIARELLCIDLPAAPADMPDYDDYDDQIRPYLSGFSPECASCHQQIDSFGLALENYDALGRYRTSYPDRGEAIDPKVTLPPSVGAPSESGTAGVSEALVKSDAFTSCTAQKLYTYGFGRAFSESERPHVEALANRWRHGPSTLRDLIQKLVLSPEFRGQSGGEP